MIEEKIKAGETKVQIAKELGVSTSTLYNYLKAINYPLKHEKTR